MIIFRNRFSLKIRCSEFHITVSGRQMFTKIGIDISNIFTNIYFGTWLFVIIHMLVGIVSLQDRL